MKININGVNVPVTFTYEGGECLSVDLGTPLFNDMYIKIKRVDRDGMARKHEARLTGSKIENGQGSFHVEFTNVYAPAIDLIKKAIEFAVYNKKTDVSINEEGVLRHYLSSI